jgi:hypothetical protein
MNKSMYSTLDDQRQAKVVLEYMRNKYRCRLKDIIQDCLISRRRLAYLEQQGYLSLFKQTPFGERNVRKNN